MKLSRNKQISKNKQIFIFQFHNFTTINQKKYEKFAEREKGLINKKIGKKI